MRRMLVHLLFALVIFTVWVVAYRAACDSRLLAAQHTPRAAFGACDDDLAEYDDDHEIGDVRKPTSTAPATRLTLIACPRGE